MIIDIGTGVDESVVKWKYNDKDKWHDADIDELIHLYESVVHCKDCRWWQDDYMGTWCSRLSGVRSTNADDYCSWGERKSNRGEEVNDFKSVGQAWNTSQGRWEL